MSTAVELFDKNRDMFAQMIPQGLGLTVDRFKQVMIYCMRITPQLGDCDPGSMVAAVAQVAQLGLDLTPAAGQAYLVPYKSRCQLQIGYKGYIALAVRSGDVKSVTAYPVYSGDAFEFEYGTEERVRHVPALKDRGELVAAWAVAVLADGRKVFRVIGADDIAKAEAFGQAKRPDSPWRVHRDEMARKTAIRRLVRDLVLSSVVGRAMAADDMIVKGMSEDGEVIDGEWVQEPAAERAPLPAEKRATAMKDRLSRPADPRPALMAAVKTFNATQLDLVEFVGEKNGKDPGPVAGWPDDMVANVLARLQNGGAPEFKAWLAERLNRSAVPEWRDGGELNPETDDMPE